ncbi:hypothetical protein AB0D67_15555 [Streptosporangium sp. NPDC048047]|uniref:hypothetical protein n=1 Tax=Streptosporangium sp. NPDC048047 TaxID=3155748 RepID=UPI003419D05D
MKSIILRGPAGRSGAPARRTASAGIAMAVAGAVILPGTTATAGTAEAVGSRPVTAARVGTASAEGAYWHTRTLTTYTRPRPLGRGANRYRVVERELLEEWTARDGESWSGVRKLGVRPATAADERAWRRDGSPTTWKDGGLRLSTRPDAGALNKTRNVTGFYLVERWRPYREIQGLPTEPEALKAWIKKAARNAPNPDDEPEARIPEEILDGYTAEVLVSLLYSVPVSKAVRTAAYRALPTLPGVRPLSGVKDPQGRAGRGFLIERDHRGSASEVRTVVDTGAMTLLSEHHESGESGKPAIKDRTSVILEAGWTDDRPSVPALP